MRPDLHDLVFCFGFSKIETKTSYFDKSKYHSKTKHQIVQVRMESLRCTNDFSRNEINAKSSHFQAQCNGTVTTNETLSEDVRKENTSLQEVITSQRGKHSVTFFPANRNPPRCLGDGASDRQRPLATGGETAWNVKNRSGRLATRAALGAIVARAIAALSGDVLSRNRSFPFCAFLRT